MFLVLIGFLIIILTLSSALKLMVGFGVILIALGLWSEFHRI